MSVLTCKTVRIFAYSSTRDQSNRRSGTKLKTESETRERRFFLSPHTPACAPRVRKTLTPRFTDFFTGFKKKTRLFCSLPLTRFWLRTLTHVNFNHVNKIEAR